jgi:hypothetical protein
MTISSASITAVDVSAARYGDTTSVRLAFTYTITNPQQTNGVFGEVRAIYQHMEWDVDLQQYVWPPDGTGETCEYINLTSASTTVTRNLTDQGVKAYMSGRIRICLIYAPDANPAPASQTRFTNELTLSH